MMVQKQEIVAASSDLSGILQETTMVTCRWCQRPILPRQSGGSSQIYCSPFHRKAFHKAARLWAEREISLGNLSIDQLKAMLTSVYAAGDVVKLAPALRLRSNQAKEVDFQPGSTD